jgi:hypothetical protein
MNATTRRILIPMLIGVLAAFGSLAVLTFIRQDKCLDAGGQWDAARRMCLAANGTAYTSGLLGGWGLVVAAFIAVLIAGMLWRIYTFPRRNRGRSGQ